MKLNGIIFRLPIVVLIGAAGEIKGDAAARHIGKSIERVALACLGEQVLGDFVKMGKRRGEVAVAFAEDEAVYACDEPQ